MDLSVLNRIPPQSLEAEQSVLGAMLLDKDVISNVTEVVKSGDFYRESHKEIFEAILDIFEMNEPVDLITIKARLESRGSLEKVGGISYLSDIAAHVPTTANATYYAKIVEEKSLLRKLIKAGDEIANISYQAAEEVELILDKAEKAIFDIMEERNTSGFSIIKDVLIASFEQLETLYNNHGQITGVESGFTDLDIMLSGFQKSDLVLIAARPAMGKTAFVLNIAQHAAVKKKVPVAVFSLEMSKEQLVNRLLACEAMVDSHKLRTGKLEDTDWQKLAMATSVMTDAPIYIDDNASNSIMEIRSKCRRLKLEKGLGMVIIDYLQLMNGRGKSDSRQQEISEISRSLKIMAKELNVPVLTLSQLSRAPEQRADHRPILSDLRESGAIEQDADIVIFLYRDDYYNEESEEKNIAEVIIAKHRAGSTGKVKLAWMGEYTKFGNLAR